jgi:membrane-bound lytic murein transglycosylase
MRDLDTIETELMEIGAIADDSVKLERIIAWCATHPDEVPLALHQLLHRRGTAPSEETGE